MLKIKQYFYQALILINQTFKIIKPKPLAKILLFIKTSPPLKYYNAAHYGSSNIDYFLHFKII